MTDFIKFAPLLRDGDYEGWASSMRAYLITQKRLDELLDEEPPAIDAQELKNDIFFKDQLQLRVAGPL
jgi:hypothetical protein